MGLLTSRVSVEMVQKVPSWTCRCWLRSPRRPVVRAAHLATQTW